MVKDKLVNQVVDKLDGVKTWEAVYEAHFYVTVKAKDKDEARRLSDAKFSKRISRAGASVGRIFLRMEEITEEGWVEPKW